MTYKDVIRGSAHACAELMSFVSSPEAIDFMSRSAEMLSSAFANGKKVLIAGNGGSLCDAAHFAEELTGCFRKRRRALPALVLSEMGHITCVGNDFGFDAVFSRGVEAFGTPGDVFIGLSTSGNSANIIAAISEAKRLSLSTICLLGKGGGSLAKEADLELIVPNAVTSDRIQEVHMACLHIIIEGVEQKMFYSTLS
jgi:D-sedoheptulose 7-phosphate isomerase